MGGHHQSRSQRQLFREQHAWPERGGDIGAGQVWAYDPVRGSNGNDIVGVNSDGQLFRVAENVINDSEFCGGCFSHDGRFMFVNIQSPGLTLVIEGPWRTGQR